MRQLRRELLELIELERGIISTISEDTKIRLAVARGSGVRRAPYAVYTDFDHSYALTTTIAHDLPLWSDLSEWLKIVAGYLATIEESGYAFTANISPDLEQYWCTSGLRVNEQVQKRIKRELDKVGLGDLAYGYVIEGRSRSGKSKNKLHLHGYLCPTRVLDSVRFKIALERGLLGGNMKRVGRSRAIDIPRAYDREHDGFWAGVYMTKNHDKYDHRLAHGRTFMSRALTQGAREFWSLVRDEPL